MTIRNIVPRNNNEGQLGTENKKWNKIYTNEIFATNFTGNLTGIADNAIKDNKSQQIDATYIKNISINNDTLTVTKGNDDSQDITINNISHAISSDNATNASKLQGLTTGNKNGQIPINNGTENANLNAALLNGKASSYFATSNHNHNTATQSSNGYMSNADKKKLDGIASGAEVNQNAFANVKVGSTTIQSDAKQDTLELVAGTNISLVGDANNDKVTIGVTGKVASASQADNATNATKATQDSAGQTINTTYVKGVTASNATLTITKGNGSTSTTTINNVSNATNANNLVISGTSAHIKYGGGDVDENTAISQNKVNLLIGSWYSTGFRDLCSSGNPIRVAINHRNGNIKTTGNVTANGAMYSATPGTSDNSTRVATTAFVQSLINSLKGSIGGAIVASNLAQNGYVKFSSGLILQWGNNNGQGSYSRKVYSFPVAYSSAVYMMSANPKGNVGTGATKNAHSANVESLTQFSISVGEHNSMFWFSIGK